MSIEEEGLGGQGFEPREVDQSPQDSEHAAKVRSRQQKWGELMPELRSKYCDALPRSISRCKSQASSHQEALQTEIDAWGAGHHCSCEDAQESQLSRQPDGQVLYMGLEACFLLKLHNKVCNCCNQSCSPHALDFGCFPSTPTTAHVWYDLRLLQLYKKYGPMDGLSATGEFTSELMITSAG